MRLLVVACLAALACRRPAPPPAARPAAPAPQTREACVARPCNGEWKVHGLLDQESCVCRTTDGGKRCRDGNECQGVCLADDLQREIVIQGPPPKGYWVGKCSNLVTVFGCHKLIEKGAARLGPAPLGDGPDEICVD